MTDFFYGLSGTPKKCFDGAVSDQVAGGVPGDGPSNASSWGYQRCTELLHPFSVPPNSWRTFSFSLDEQTSLCQRYYGTSPRMEWMQTWGGGYGLVGEGSSLTNVIWSNGKRDPWHGGGILTASRTGDCGVGEWARLARRL